MMSLTSFLKQARRKFRVKNRLLQECLAEFLGVFLLVFIGGAAVAQVQTTGKGSYLSINIAYGVGVMFGIYVSGGVSGAHLNPAVSISFCVLGKLSWWKVPFYILSQILGGFVAAAVILAMYYDSIMHFTGGELIADGGPLATGGIFSTYPAEYLTTRNGFIDQVVATGILLLVILSLNDSQNNEPPEFLKPILIGVLVLVIGIAMGSNCGYPINPARDFGPRLFSYFAGYGSQVFTAGDNWWWVPLVAPVLGGLVGCFFYEILIEMHHPNSKPQPQTSEESPTPTITSSIRGIANPNHQP
ncbi:aquaporin-10-like isoform X2 [Callorhinchus milii]|uniref:aquaporin-10-like isoform X2 n=1 Tax=Callorhinchus milii TaxID=7868 RepID=UPI001C3F54D0|nr:aquaporin-10-like isoform X2 [Callorhinchus milii]